MPTNANISFKKGGRDEALFRIANSLVKGGESENVVRSCLNQLAKNCTPPFPPTEVEAKIKSAFDRAAKLNRNLTQELRELIMTTSGNISTTFVYSCQHLTTREEKKKAQVILGRLVKEGLIERTGNQAGVYRRIEHDCDQMDFLGADTETLDIWLPFKLHNLVETMPGNIILVAGDQNAGKTGLLLNIIQANMSKFDIHYFNSEMGASELKKRLLKFAPETTLKEWNFKAYERSSRFADVIKPGNGKINIIDFLELHDNFYEVGGMLSDIHRKLHGAIAIVALQKNPGSDVGLGGFRSLEKPRLALAMGHGYLKIVKGKNWATEKNPKDLQVNYKIVQGCRFVQTKDWHKA